MQSATPHFYPRSPCGERRRRPGGPFRLMLFLSTLSLRRATPHRCRLGWSQYHFYPRSPCGERHPLDWYLMILENFYPRSPCGERPGGLWPVGYFINFYPRSPCGERRHGQSTTLRLVILFLSTLSLRRATAKVHKTVGHFCAYETNFMEIASSC